MNSPASPSLLLPAFRIRNLHTKDGVTGTDFCGSSPNEVVSQQAEADVSGHEIVQGTICMQAREYDNVVSKCQAAALRYIDDDDGEVVKVGTAFELKQRLQEPIPTIGRFANKHTSRKPPSPPAIHSFDIENTNEVLHIWRDLDSKTRSTIQATCESPEAPKDYKAMPTALTPEAVRALHFKATNPPDLSAIYARKPEATAPCQRGNLTLEGQRLAKLAANAITVGRSPTAAGTSSIRPLAEPTYENRWASYNNTIGTSGIETVGRFTHTDRKVVSIATQPMDSTTDSVPSTVKSAKASPPTTHKNHWSSCAELAFEVNSLTLPEKTSQRREEVAKGDGKDIREVSEVVIEKSVDEASEQHRPLLDLFEAELAKLMKSSSAHSVPQPAVTTEKSSRASRQAPQFEQTVPETLPNVSVQGQSQGLSIDSFTSLPILFATSFFAPLSTVPSEQVQSAGDVIARSVKMLLEGVGSLATTVTAAHAELQQHVAVGRHGFPSSLERALQASAAALDGLRGMVPTVTSSTEVVAEVTEPLRAEEDKNQKTSKTPIGEVELAGPMTTAAGDEESAVSSGITQRGREESTGDFVKAHLEVCTTCFIECYDGVNIKDKRGCPLCVPSAKMPVAKGVCGTISKVPRALDVKPSARCDVVEISGHDYRVEKIVGRRYLSYSHTNGPTFTQYLVRWHGHGLEDDVWYDDLLLGGCRKLVANYERKIALDSGDRSHSMLVSASKMHVLPAQHAMRVCDVSDGVAYLEEETFSRQRRDLQPTVEDIEDAYDVKSAGAEDRHVQLWNFGRPKSKVDTGQDSNFHLSRNGSDVDSFDSDRLLKEVDSMAFEVGDALARLLPRSDVPLGGTQATKLTTQPLTTVRPVNLENKSAHQLLSLEKLNESIDRMEKRLSSKDSAKSKTHTRRISEFDERQRRSREAELVRAETHHSFKFDPISIMAKYPSILDIERSSSTNLSKFTQDDKITPGPKEELSTDVGESFKRALNKSKENRSTKTLMVPSEQTVDMDFQTPYSWAAGLKDLHDHNNTSFWYPPVAAFHTSPHADDGFQEKNSSAAGSKVTREQKFKPATPLSECYGFYDFAREKPKTPIWAKKAKTSHRDIDDRSTSVKESRFNAEGWPITDTLESPHAWKNSHHDFGNRTTVADDRFDSTWNSWNAAPWSPHNPAVENTVANLNPVDVNRWLPRDYHPYIARHAEKTPQRVPSALRKNNQRVSGLDEVEFMNSRQLWEVIKSDKITTCAQDLQSMGYTSTSGRDLHTLAESVGGELHKAVDVLEDDARAYGGDLETENGAFYRSTWH